MRRRISGYAVWLAVASFAGFSFDVYAQQPVPEDAAQQHLHAATQEASQGNLPAAMADIKAAIALNPNGAAGWYQLGSLFGQTGDFAGAESALRHAIDLDPTLAKAHYSLALALVGNPQGKQDWAGAIAECREALKLHPDYAEALNLMGAALNNTGKPDAAIPVLRQSIELSPTLAEAHFNLALALERCDHLDEAVLEYQAAIAAKNAYPEANSALAKLLFRMGKTDAAEQQVRAALRINPDLTDAHYTLARILSWRKRAKEADIEFAEAKELTERQSNGIQSANLSNLGLQQATGGDLPGAIKTLRKAIDLKPDYGVPHYNLGLLLADTGDVPGALQELAKGISLLPGQAKPWFDFGRAEHLAKDDPAALHAIAWAAYLSPSDTAIQSELNSLRAGIIESGATSKSSGGSASGSADPSAPVDPVADQPAVGASSDTYAGHLAFARALIARSDFQGAAGELLRSLALDPAGLEARRSLADTYIHLEDNERAELEYDKILLSFPEDVEANLSLGKLLVKRRDREGGLEYLRRALRLRPGSPEIRAELERAEKLPANH